MSIIGKQIDETLREEISTDALLSMQSMVEKAAAGRGFGERIPMTCAELLAMIGEIRRARGIDQ